MASNLSYVSGAVLVDESRYDTERAPASTSRLASNKCSLTVGALMLLPLTIYVDQPNLLEWSLPSLLATLLLGVFSTGLATWVYFRVVTDCGPGFLSIINYIIPAIAFAAGVAFLGESAAPSQFLGMLLVLMGIAMIQNRPVKLQQ